MSGENAGLADTRSAVFENRKAWGVCPKCSSAWCFIHKMHVSKCPCPPLHKMNCDPFMAGLRPLREDELGLPPDTGCESSDPLLLPRPWRVVGRTIASAPTPERPDGQTVLVAWAGLTDALAKANLELVVALANGTEE